MLPNSRKEMEAFIAAATDGKLEVHWIEQGQCAYHPTADGKIFLEEREELFLGADAEEKLKEFFRGAAFCGEKGVTLRHQGLQKFAPYDFATQTSKPGGHAMAFAFY